MKFKLDNREFDIRVTTAVIRRVRADTGIDLLDLDKAAGKIGDPVALSDILFSALRPEMDQEAFDDLLSGDDIESAASALVEALIDFFPKAQADQFRALQAKGEKATAIQREKLAAEIEAIDPETMFENREMSGDNSSS